jgi:hypothetical protein
MSVGRRERRRGSREKRWETPLQLHLHKQTHTHTHKDTYPAKQPNVDEQSHLFNVLKSFPPPNPTKQKTHQRRGVESVCVCLCL